MRRRRATVAAVATPGEWQCKMARSSEWAQHFSNASCIVKVWDFFLPKFNMQQLINNAFAFLFERKQVGTWMGI